MQPAQVLGTTHATMQDESFVGMRLVVLQPLGVDDKFDGPPLIAFDQFGARAGDKVMINSDGSYAREACGHPNTPARWTVMGIIDENE